MHIGQPSHGGARWWSTVGHPAREFRDTRLLTVTTATGWTRHRRRFRANCIMEVFFNDCQASNQWTVRAAVTAVTAKCPKREKNWKVCTVFRIAYWHSLCEPRLVRIRTVTWSWSQQHESRARVRLPPRSARYFNPYPVYICFELCKRTPGVQFNNINQGQDSGGTTLWTSKIATF